MLSVTSIRSAWILTLADEAISAGDPFRSREIAIADDNFAYAVK